MTTDSVMIVEDDGMLRRALVLRLQQEPVAVLECRGADEALTLLHARSSHGEPTRILCTDVDMPGALNGAELADAVSRQWPETRIVVNSAAPRDSMELPDGATFIPKSSGLPQLVTTMMKLLEQAESDR